MRTIIDLPEQQLTALETLCEREKISRAEAIRRAVESWLLVRMPAERRSAFGTWSKDASSREILEKLRNEWEDDSER